MLADTQIGVAILGGRNISNHLAAISKVSAIRLVGVSAEGMHKRDLPLGVNIFANYAEILNNPLVQGLVFLTSENERGYWIEKGSSAGKHILCCLSPTSTFGRTREIVENCKRQGVYLTLYPGFNFPNLKSAISRIIKKREIGTFLYFDIKIEIPRASFLNEQEGALLLYGMPYLYFFQEFGVVDSIRARTRSLGYNRPTEDIAIAQIKFKNGLEGLFYLNGLGENEGLKINLYGSNGSIKFSGDKYIPPKGLESYYSDFVGVVQHGGEPFFGGAEITSSHYYLDWIQQAARLDKEILSKDARIS